MSNLIERFYSSFQKLDYRSMQECYHSEATFFDPVFGALNAEEVRAMWEMLCKNAEDFSLEFSDIKENEVEGSCKWVATYTFSRTHRKVVNRIEAHFEFKEGKIFKHQDEFSFWCWSRQAFGLAGWLLGWFPPFQHKIREGAKARLFSSVRHK